MTTKKELIEYLKTKKGVKEDKIKTTWEEKEKEVKESGITNKEQIEKMTMLKVSLYFRKLISAKEETEVSIIPLGFSNVTDYGATRFYNEAKTVFSQDKDRAILERYTNEQGTPLWRNNPLVSKNGKPILLDKEKRRTMYCFAKRPEDTIWKIGVMSFQGELVTNNPPTIGKLYETAGIIAKATTEVWNNERIIMYSGTTTNFKTNKNTPETMKEMIEKYAKPITIPFSEIHNRAKMENANKDYFIVKVSVPKTKEMQIGTSNIISVCDPEEVLFDEEKQIDGWIAEDIPLYLIDEAMDVYILASARTYNKKTDKGTEEEALQFNIFGYVANEKDMKTPENTPLIGNEGQQIIVEEEFINDKVGGWDK